MVWYEKPTSILRRIRSLSSTRRTVCNLTQREKYLSEDFEFRFPPARFQPRILVPYLGNTDCKKRNIRLNKIVPSLVWFMIPVYRSFDLLDF